MKRPTLTIAIALTALLVSPITQAAARQLPRYGLATRVENHMLPAVSTGPLDPAWSPDGGWIAFSMHGDIWKISAAGGLATALTHGPAYHFEPAWSPDGTQLAYVSDVDGNLDIGIVSAQGGMGRRITTHEAADVQPAWAPDGQSIYFTSARNGNLDIFRLEIETGSISPVVIERGHQFSPAVSPDADRVAYISPVSGRLGSGGIWIKTLSTQETRLTHYEETSYRPTPQWTPDGRSLVYASDAAGSYDLAIVPSSGGNRVRLTHEPLDEFAPAVSPDGTRIAFVSNRHGPTRLYTMPIAGGARGAWEEVVISSRDHSSEMGRLRVTVRGEDGLVTPAGFHAIASDGRAYTPHREFHRVSPANELHYFHTRGSFALEVPPGPVNVEVTRGFEYRPAKAEVDVPAGEVLSVELRLDRIIDAPQLGWISGDTHVHDLHEGRYGLTHEEFFYQFVAEDLHVANALIHMDGTKLMGRWEDLTGHDFVLSNSDYILRYSQEFRGSFGHVGLLGVQRFIMPLIGGTRASPYDADVLKTRYLDGVVDAGGIGGFLHPYNGDTREVAIAAQSDIPVHAALGRGQFFDVVSIASDELASSAIYYRMLNTGVRMAATGGTDNFSNVWRDPSGGTARTYAHVNQRLSWSAWINAVREGRTFATNSPLLFVTVNGQMPGAEIRRDADDTTSLTVSTRLVSIAPVDRVEIIVNGQIVTTHHPDDDSTRMDFRTNVQADEGGWIAVRAIGDRHRYTGDNYVFAHTSPVYIVQGDRTFTVAEDAQFLIDVIDAIWERVEARNGWHTQADRNAYIVQMEEARNWYRRAIANATTATGR